VVALHHPYPSRLSLSQAGAVAGEVAQGAKVAADFIKPYVDAAAPVVRDVAKESVKLASPVVESGVQSALKQLKGSGVDVDGALASANQAANATVPVLKSTAAALTNFVDAIATGDPSTVATAVGTGVLLVLLSPLLLPALAGCAWLAHACCSPPCSRSDASCTLQAAAWLHG
jgi:hypothetical protein